MACQTGNAYVSSIASHSSFLLSSEKPMYPIHASIIHLPIGLLLGSAILTLLYIRRGDSSYETAAYHCLWIGWLGALVAIVSGTADAVQHLFNATAPRDDALNWINAHGFVGLGVLAVYWSLWQSRRHNPNIVTNPETRQGYLYKMAFGIVLLLLDGWLGGHLVYSLGLGVQ
jgi:uncharacterized membrane protein